MSGQAILRESHRLFLNRVLVVSGNVDRRTELRDWIQRADLDCTLIEAESGARALEILYEEEGADVLVVESALPDLVPEELCVLVTEYFPGIEVLTVQANGGLLRFTGFSEGPTARQLTDLLNHRSNGAPQESWHRQLPVLQDLPQSNSLRGLVGDSRRMQQVYTLSHMVAARDTTVLVTGESGTGKDLVALAIHGLGRRQKEPFVVVNCAAVPEALLEAELFGYTKGAFTGAMQARIGRIHAAHGGTLFLDEIGDMPLALQSKILRFLEQGEVQRLGGNDNLKVDVRVIAATNADLKKLAEQKLFREDLYYRLAVFLIQLPPLRDRLGDIPKLVQTFVAKFCPDVALHPSVFEKLAMHHWPGNVRELRNVIERASIMIGTELEMTADHILI